MKKKQLSIKALKESKGDDLYRAEQAFKTYTDKQMNEPYGHYIEKMPKQILEEYEVHEIAIDEAISWLVSLNEKIHELKLIYEIKSVYEIMNNNA